MFRFTTLITVPALIPFVCQAGENVPLDKLPGDVVSAIHAEYPDAELLKAELEREEEVTFYEVDVIHQGIKMEIDVSPEGKVLAIDEKLKNQN